MKPICLAIFAASVVLYAIRLHAGVVIDFRYGDGIDTDLFEDTTGFFDDPARRNLLDAAAAYVTSTLSDHLAAIPASAGFDIWSTVFRDPSFSGESDRVLTDFMFEVVPQDTLIVFVSGRTFSNLATLADADAGRVLPLFTANDTFIDLVESRGQAGALESPRTDYGPWGGSIAFNVARPWSFASLEESPLPGKDDFFSVAVHEIGHILGIGTAASWGAQIKNNTFEGEDAMAVFGGPVPVANDAKHFANSGIVPEPALDPILLPGTRKLLTELDKAALKDIGWEVSPSAMVFLAADSEPVTTGIVVDPVTESVNLSGPFDIILVDGFVPNFGDMFPVVTANTRDGTFDQIDGVLPEGNEFALAPIYDYQGIDGLALVTVLPGDVNLDDNVDLDDLLILLNNAGTDSDWIEGDLTGDRNVDLDDLLILLNNAGTSAMPSMVAAVSASPFSASVPEPATLTLLALGSLAMLRRSAFAKQR